MKKKNGGKSTNNINQGKASKHRKRGKAVSKSGKKKKAKKNLFSRKGSGDKPKPQPIPSPSTLPPIPQVLGSVTTSPAPTPFFGAVAAETPGPNPHGSKAMKEANFSCVLKGTELPKDFPDANPTSKQSSVLAPVPQSKGTSTPKEVIAGPPAPVPIPAVTCDNCAVQNVAIDVAIDTERISDLTMRLFSPDGKEVLLVDQPPSGANLSPDVPITFDDSDTFTPPLELGLGLFSSEDIPAGTYNAEGVGLGSGTYPNPGGLVKFNGLNAKGVWTFEVYDNVPGPVGAFVESVELTITCSPLLTCPGGPGDGSVSVGGGCCKDVDCAFDLGKLGFFSSILLIRTNVLSC